MVGTYSLRIRLPHPCLKFSRPNAAFHTAAAQPVKLRYQECVLVEVENKIGDLHELLAVGLSHTTPLYLNLKKTLIMKGILANKDKAELLLKAQQLKALERPSNRDYQSVLSFMENDGGQLFEEDMGFIYEKEDLVTLRPGREYAWLDGLLERTLKVLRCRLIKASLIRRDLISIEC